MFAIRLFGDADDVVKLSKNISRDHVSSISDQGYRVTYSRVSEESSSLDTDTAETSSPFWGGSAISGGGHGCTAAFPVYDSVKSVRYLLTAGHCKPVASGTVKWYGGLSGGGAYVGAGAASTWYHGKSSRGDFAIIANGTGTMYGSRIYPLAPHPIADTNMRKIRNWDRQIYSGLDYCINGTRSRPACGFKQVNGLNYYKDRDSGTVVSNVAKLESSGAAGPIPGDSGGPVYRTYSDGVSVAGVISGQYGQGKMWAASIDVLQGWLPQLTPVTE